MRHYTLDGIFVEGDSPPLRLKDGVSPIPTESGMSYRSEDFDAWEEASPLEYRLYLSRINNYLVDAPRDDQAGMWAFNHGSEHLMRLGGNWPDDGESVDHITNRDEKIKLVMATQHWYRSDRPKSVDTNSTWTKWIIRARNDEPFIYLGRY